VSARPGLDDETLWRIRAMWAALAGADGFPVSDVRVVCNAGSEICPRGWAGVVAIERGILATVPSVPDVGSMAGLLRDVGPDGDWVAAFASAPEVRGPANLAYTDRLTTPSPAGARAVELVAVESATVRAFVERVPDADRDEAPVEASTSPLACVRDGSDVVAAAGYRVWLDEVAHLAVLVDPVWRDRGLATAVAHAATERALARGLVAQWRARPPASRAVARKLGYVDVGQQISVRLA